MRFSIVVPIATASEDVLDAQTGMLSSLIQTTLDCTIDLVLLENFKPKNPGDGKYVHEFQKIVERYRSILNGRSSITYMNLKEPFNMNRFYNIGYKIVRDIAIPDYIIFCNSDLYFRAGWAAAVIAAFAEHSDAGSIIPASSLQTYQFMMATDRGQRSFEGFRVGKEREELAEFTSVAGPGWMFCFEHDTWVEKLNPWPEEFRAWYQDWEIYERMKAKGLRSYATYAATVDHLEGVTFKNLRARDPQEFKTLTNDQKSVWDKRPPIEETNPQ